MGHLAAELAARQPSFTGRAEGLGNALGRVPGQAGEHLPLFGRVELIEAWMTLSGTSQHIVLQAL